MDEKILNKPINLQNLSLALAKVKAEYTAGFHEVQYSFKDMAVYTETSINNIPGSWDKILPDYWDRQVYYLACIRVEKDDGEYVYMNRSYADGDDSGEAYFKSTSTDDAIYYSSDNHAYCYRHDGVETILTGAALEDFSFKAQIFTPCYVPMDVWGQFIFNTFPNGPIREVQVLSTKDFYNCLILQFNSPLYMTFFRTAQSNPSFTSIDGMLSLTYNGGTGEWVFQDGTVIPSDLSGFNAVSGATSEYVVRHSLEDILSGLISGRFMSCNELSSMDELLDIKPIVLYGPNFTIYFRRKTANDDVAFETLDYSPKIIQYNPYSNVWEIDGEEMDAESQAEFLSNASMYVADKPGITTIICGAGEYDPVTLEPTLAGEEGMTYLVPKPPEEIIPTTIGSAVIGQSTIGTSTYTDPTNGYQEWIYTHGAYERVGEKIATDKQFEDMLKSIGLIDSTAVADEAVVGEALVG